MPVKLYKISTKGLISKDKPLEEIKSLIEIEELKINYEEYMRPALLWVREDLESIAKALDVEKIVRMGAYIRGLFGGEEKRTQKYAGLVINHYAEHDGFILIKLVNLDKAYSIPAELMKKYEVGVYQLYYEGLINPFKCRTHSVLLSSNEENLREFLRKMIDLNRGVMTTQDMQKLKVLIEELKASLDCLDQKSYYAIYRTDRAFTACVPEDLNAAASSSTISYLKCKSLEQAYYYVAVLNYLAYKVIETNRSFLRHQWSRPATAIMVANLSWRDLPNADKKDIYTLSKQLSKKIRWKKYPDQGAALRDIAQIQEFKEIISILDSHVDKERFKTALDLVSESK